MHKLFRLDGLQSETHVWVIHPNTNDRTRVHYAPYTVIVFFWGIREDDWSKLAPEFFPSIAKADALTGYTWERLPKQCFLIRVPVIRSWEAGKEVS